MECANVAHAEHWWDHDYAQISQFHGRWFLHGFGRGHVTNVLFIIGNNAVVNLSLASKLGVPFIESASNCLNLAVNNFFNLNKYSNKIKKVPSIVVL